MRYVGRITDWNDARGFGFVTPNGGGERAFVHVKAFAARGRRPAGGDLVSYALVRDPRGRTNATAVRFAGASAPPPRAPAAGSDAWRTWVALSALTVLGVGAWRGHWPLALPALYAGMSVVALLAYWRDKSAARQGGWRTPENTLHLLALLGGWPGALLAQRWLRHKSRKAGFQAVFWCTVVANGVALAWWLRTGAASMAG